MAEQHTDHDKLFKSALQDIESAREFLRHFLPSYILNDIDLKKLKLDSTNYIRENLEEQNSDLVFETVFLRHKNILFLLLEHKSYIDRELIIQIINYIFGIFNRDITENRAFSFVLPIVVYHGNRKSKPKPLYSYFKNLPPYLHKFVPSVEFIFVNLGTTSNAELLKLSDKTLLKSAFLALKNIGDADFIKIHFNEFVKFLDKKPHYYSFMRQIMLYLYRHSPIKQDEFNSFITSQTNKTLKMELSTAVKGAWAEAVEEGITQGITQGISQGELKKTIAVVRKGWLKGHSIKVIADLADISIEEVKRYISEFENEKK